MASGIGATCACQDPQAGRVPRRRPGYAVYRGVRARTPMLPDRSRADSGTAGVNDVMIASINFWHCTEHPNAQLLIYPDAGHARSSSIRSVPEARHPIPGGVMRHSSSTVTETPIACGLATCQIRNRGRMTSWSRFTPLV